MDYVLRQVQLGWRNHIPNPFYALQKKTPKNTWCFNLKVAYFTGLYFQYNCNISVLKKLFKSNISKIHQITRRSSWNDQICIGLLRVFQQDHAKIWQDFELLSLKSCFKIWFCYKRIVLTGTIYLHTFLSFAQI